MVNSFAPYVPYVIDTETTNLDYDKGDIIELSVFRLTDSVQKTWYIKPLSIEHIQPDALRVNGHQLDDILWKTKAGRDKYKEPASVLIELERFFLDDDARTDDRILVGHNVTAFDLPYLKSMYKKNNCMDSFPFGMRYLDTLQLEFFLNFAKDPVFASQAGYSLAASLKKYGLKNEKAHSAEFDTKATAQLFQCLLDKYKEKSAIIDSQIKNTDPVSDEKPKRRSRKTAP